MLITILATPRTGSTTLWKSYKSEWRPKNHPAPHGFSEFYHNYAFKNPKMWRAHLSYDQYLKNIKHMISKEEIHNELIDHVTKNPDSNIAVKVFPSQLDSQMMKQLLDSSSIIVHCVRKSYKNQLQSYVVSQISNIWKNERPSMVEVNQDYVNMYHQILVKEIIAHSELYKKYGGELVFLEDRFNKNQQYPKCKISSNNLIWPTFDTVSLFDNT